MKKAAHRSPDEAVRGYLNAAVTSLEIAARRAEKNPALVGKIKGIIEDVEAL